MRKKIIPWTMTTLAALLVSGCHLVVGPDEGRLEWWYYCDATGCYRCTPAGCELPGDYCSNNADCPESLRCDLDDHLCRTKLSCTRSSECGAGNVCIGERCVPGVTPCTDNASCGAGAYCSNGTCKDSGLCSGDADCTPLGDMTCENGTCVPRAAPATTCENGSGCADGLCLDGQCGSCAGDCGGGVTCQFNAHCASGQVCLDGHCTSSCTANENCASGQICKNKVCVTGSASGSCKSNSDCASGEQCLNAICYADCTATGTCASSLDVCSPAITVALAQVKVCLPNHAASPACKVNKDCTGGELCVNGICRTSCATNTDCAACPGGPVCAAGGFCMTALEAAPQCARSADCTGGKVCLNAQCVTL